MAGVYQGSLCNIAAVSSKNSDAGCFYNRDPTLLPSLKITTSYNNEDIDAEYTYCFERDDDDYYESHQPLFSRGWVFQERILAPRMLGFSAEYAFWRCKMKQASERNFVGFIPDTYVFKLKIIGQKRKEKIKWWHDTLELYSSMLLTKASDKLVAISGIAKILHSLDSSNKYIAGLVSKNSFHL